MRERTRPPGCMEIQQGNLYNVQSALSQLGGLVLVSGIPTYFYPAEKEAFLDLYLKPQMISEKNKKFIDEADTSHAGKDLAYILRPATKDAKPLKVGTHEFDTQFKISSKMELFNAGNLALYIPNNPNRDLIIPAFEFCLYHQIKRLNSLAETGINDEHMDQMLSFIMAHLQMKKVA